MFVDPEALRFIFGLKLKSLRTEKGLSLKDLALQTGLSPSYLNEMEKGKKYPKSEKILSLSKALQVPYEDLVSLKLGREFSSLSHLIEKNQLRGLPFDVFGFPAQSLYELMAERPQKFGALVATAIELARNHNIRIEEVFTATLRAYLAMNGNYFPELEKAALKFKKDLGVASGTNWEEFIQGANIAKCLEEQFGYKIVEKDFSQSTKDLEHTDYFFDPDQKHLFINRKIGARQKLFLMCRELGHCFLGHKERFLWAWPQQVDSYAPLFNDFQASYFAGCLLIPFDGFVAQIKDFFSWKNWQAAKFLEWVNGTPGTRRNFMHRLTQVVPQAFGIENLFYFRFSYRNSENDFRMLRELHLSELQVPHRLQSVEHYCRRWVATSNMQKLCEENGKVRAEAQRASYHQTGREYFCLSLAYDMNLSPEIKEGVTVGFLVDDRLKKEVQFLEDPLLDRKLVSRFCEFCDIRDCRERVAEPVLFQVQEKESRVEKAMRQYMQNNS